MQKPKLSMDEKREAARKIILDASMELFYTKGYEATTTRDIVNKAGILNGSLYNRFRNKEEILVCLVDEGIRDIMAAAADLMEREHNLLLAASLPGSVQIYMASKSQRIAELIYHVHGMWSAVDSYLKLNLDWSEKFLSAIGIDSTGSESTRMNMISIIGSVGNLAGYYAHGGSLALEEVLRHHITLVATVLNLPAVNAADIAGRLIGILESTDIVFMGHNLSEEIPELAASHRK